VVDLGFTSQEIVYRALSECSGLPFTLLAKQEIAEEATKRVPAKIALHYKFVPISLERGTLTAAFSDPPSMRDRQNLRLLLGLRLEPVIATPAEVSNTLKSVYGLGAETVIQLRQDRGYKKNESIYHDAIQGEDLGTEDDETASIIGLVNQILLEAVEMETTDIHIEPFEDTIRLRYRIDGMLREIPTPPGMHDLHEAIVSRMKIMANLNIAEKRLPQDGRIKLSVGGRQVDIRVSVIPMLFGEGIVMRLLDKDNIKVGLRQLGFSEEDFRKFQGLIQRPNGIILVTGPTGSGRLGP